LHKLLPFRNERFITSSFPFIMLSAMKREAGMNRSVANKGLWLIGGALLVGAAFAGLHRMLSFEIDIDPWDDAYLY
jgi:hypothetical protein